MKQTKDLWDSPLWVVTSYFNPSKYKRRLENFHTFRRFLNAPLLVVELERNGEFQLTRDDGEIVIQLIGEDRIWQKERLLNIGIENLPDHVEYVAWVDCDVVFEDENWSAKTLAMHRNGFSLLQLFETAKHLPKCEIPEKADRYILKQTTPIRTEKSAASKVHLGGGAAHLCGGAGRDDKSEGEVSTTTYALGIAWSGKREKLPATLYDRNIVGGGDKIVFAGAIGDYSTTKQYQMHSEQHEFDVRNWLQESENSGMFEKVSHLEQDVFHLWHGDFRHRGYQDRHAILSRHSYDPARDVTKAPNGAWQWTEPKGQLAKEVAVYFDERREDG